MLDPRDNNIWMRKGAPPRWAMVVGLVIFLSGGYMLAYAIGLKGFTVYEGRGEDTFGVSGPPASRTGTFWIGIAYLLGGTALALGRAGVTIDKRRGRVRRWAGLLGPWWKSDFRLELYHRVVIAYEHHSDSESQWTMFPVRLAGDNESLVQIAAPSRQKEAEELALELSLFLGWPVENLAPTPGKGGVPHGG